MGIPVAFVTALPTIAQLAGANRIVQGRAITSPTGDPSAADDAERALRRRIVERALEMLETNVGPRTVWSVDA
jgi:glycine reductase complex component B subunit gamma